jgi:hypothetical protein
MLRKEVHPLPRVRGDNPTTIAFSPDPNAATGMKPLHRGLTRLDDRWITCVETNFEAMTERHDRTVPEIQAE